MGGMRRLQHGHVADVVVLQVKGLEHSQGARLEACQRGLQSTRVRLRRGVGLRRRVWVRARPGG